MLQHKILYLWHLLLTDGGALWWITLYPELISDITHSGKTHLTFPGWKAAFRITCGAFCHIIALMTLCCSCPFIVMLPQSNVPMTSYITVYRKHSTASAMCPMLISVSHTDIAPCHHCYYVCFLLKEQISPAVPAHIWKILMFPYGECLFWHHRCFLLVWQPCCSVFFHTLRWKEGYLNFLLVRVHSFCLNTKVENYPEIQASWKFLFNTVVWDFTIQSLCVQYY